MDAFYKNITHLWSGMARNYFWGDPLDVRFYLAKRLTHLKDKKILDLGCNTGVITANMDITNEIIGIDTNEHALEIARTLNPKQTFICCDLFGVPYPPGTFDVIIAANVIPRHDFPSDHAPEELSQYIHTLLKPGGTLLLTTPNAHNSYYKGRGKFIDCSLLNALFPHTAWEKSILGWNPFPIQLGHILKYIPGIFPFLIWCAQKRIAKDRSVAFFMEARKK